MRKSMLLFVVLSSMMIGACSILDGANQSLDYVNQATAHINKLSTFAEQAPQLIKDAAANPETKMKLEEQLLALKTEIEQFNLKSVPAFAKDIHEQLVEKNKVLLDEINQVVVNGHLALDKLQNSQILATITDITGLINRISNLGS
ncbi:DUF6376 family protein [Paenibacillus chondroitinus]|uniref:DUF6376 family protein n=1 Tax=Paenibacillus chondroitinus TaxID=59842 RepID=A0ABU6D8E0_9BACL|nr:MULTISPECIES: DUF6376 family protein [Paenibacillus]MCY9659816.1 DUF6376 family protein [Paenibacillus anseongense]MEB4794005.1 DUF6376 family protein [Paenibacillus chondroitinus]